MISVPPVPLSGRSIVFVHAHPDDEAIFTGVTMSRLAAFGARVVLVTATAGEEGGTAARRLAELEAACASLGVARLGCSADATRAWPARRPTSTRTHWWERTSRRAYPSGG